MSAADIATALGNPRREGCAWRCRCPLHGGRSLVISDGRPWPRVGDMLGRLQSFRRACRAATARVARRTLGLRAVQHFAATPR